MLKNPRINRIIGYVVMFAGFVLFCKGFHTPTAADPVNGKNPILIAAALILVVAAIVWIILKVRCPHCNRMLNPKFADISKCPYCGQDTNIK